MMCLLVTIASIMRETEGSAGTSCKDSDVPSGEGQRASGISCSQQPKRKWHYVSAHLGWAQICDPWLAWVAHGN